MSTYKVLDLEKFELDPFRTSALSCLHANETARGSGDSCRIRGRFAWLRSVRSRAKCRARCKSWIRHDHGSKRVAHRSSSRISTADEGGARGFFRAAKRKCGLRAVRNPAAFERAADCDRSGSLRGRHGPPTRCCSGSRQRCRDPDDRVPPPPDFLRLTAPGI